MRTYDADGLKNQSRMHRHYVQEAVGDGTTTVFHLEHVPADLGWFHVHVDGALMAPTLNAATARDYAWTRGTNTVTFTTAPASGKLVLFYIGSV